MREQLEGQLSSKLQYPRIKRAGDLPEVSTAELVADTVELRVVEGIECLDAELETEGLLDRKRFVEGGVEVGLAGAKDSILTSAAKALVEAAGPYWNRLSKCSRVKPLFLLFRIANLPNQIRAIGIAAAQSDRVVVDVETRPLVLDEKAGFEDHGSGNLPSVCYLLHELVVPGILGEGINVIHAEDVAAIQRPGALVVLEVVGVADLGEIVSGDVDLMRPGVVELAAQTMPVLRSETGLEAIVSAVGGVLLVGNAGEPRVVTEQVRRRR